MVCRLIRHDDLKNNIIEGKIEGKGGRRKPGHSLVDRIKEKVAVGTCKEVKETALDRKN